MPYLASRSLITRSSATFSSCSIAVSKCRSITILEPRGHLLTNARLTLAALASAKRELPKQSLRMASSRSFGSAGNLVPLGRGITPAIALRLQRIRKPPAPSARVAVSAPHVSRICCTMLMASVSGFKRNHFD
jgi:hypothetical protein